MLYFITFLVIGPVLSFSTPCPDGWRQSDVVTNKCYLIVTNKKNWFDADEYCQSATANGHLTSIISAFEQANVNAIVSETQSSSVCDNMWIGANDIQQISVFTWMDGTPFSYKRWMPGQPDLSPNKLCVVSQARSSGLWSTNDCGDEFCFICANTDLHPSTTSSPQTTPYAGTTTPSIAPSATHGSNPGDCQQYLDIVFVIHLSSVPERMFQIGEFVKRLALSYHLETDYVHVGIVTYDSITRFNNANKFGSVLPANFNNMIDEIVHGSPGNTLNNIAAPLWDVKNMIGFSRGYSTDGNRKSAADVIMYITDEVEQISPNDVTNARNYIYETTDLNMPHVVVVAINTADSTAHATFDNMQSVDMDLAVFAIESYDMLNTTVVNGADYEVDRINNYVCGLLPQSLPMYCVPGQRTTTTAPPTVPPAAQCYAMDIIFVVDMSQSPNNGQLKRRDKKLVHQLGSDIKTRTVPFNYPQFIENFQNQKNILKNIIDTFPNGHYGPPVGAQFAEVSFYDTNTDFAFNLSSANTPSGYEVVIEKMLPYMGDTFIEVGLTAVRDKMLDASRGYRSNVPTIVLLFSDGNDNSASHPIPIAEQLIQKGVSIFALYNNAPDSSPNIELLRQITQNNSRVVPLDQYHTLRQSLYDIINHFIKTTGFNPCHQAINSAGQRT